MIPSRRDPRGAGAVPSPCRSRCRLDPAIGRCTGCGRTLDQIARWGAMDDDERRAVLQEIEKFVSSDDPGREIR